MVDDYPAHGDHDHGQGDSKGQVVEGLSRLEQLADHLGQSVLNGSKHSSYDQVENHWNFDESSQLNCLWRYLPQLRGWGVDDLRDDKSDGPFLLLSFDWLLIEGLG